MSSKILLYLRSDPLFTPNGEIIFYSVEEWKAETRENKGKERG